MPYPLLAPLVVLRTNQVIANVDSERRRGTCSLFDPDDLEFSGLHARQGGQIALNFAEKSLAARYDLPGKASFQDLDPASRTPRDFPSWKQRIGSDRSIEELRQARERGRRGLERPTPFAEKLHDFKRILFAEIFVRAGDHFQQKIIQRRLHGIVRSQAKISEREKRGNGQVPGRFREQQTERRCIERRWKKEYRRPPDTS